MTRLIDADELKNHKFVGSVIANGAYQLGWNDCIDAIIDNAPTVERPHGKWIDTGEMEEYWADEYQCSICGVKNHWHNFCPYCGADMREREGSENV